MHLQVSRVQVFGAWYNFRAAAKKKVDNEILTHLIELVINILFFGGVRIGN